MAHIHRIIKAGPLVVEAIYPAASRWDSPSVRAGKHKESSDAQKKMNLKYAWQKLELLIAGNFQKGDIWATFTYDDAHLPQTRKQAIRKMNSFLSRLRAVRKPRGEDTICIYCTEHKTDAGDRLHHHVLLNSTGLDYEEVQKIWHQGQIDFGEPGGLHFGRDQTYEALAKYMTKEARDKVGDRLWCATRNLRKPERECHRVPNDFQVMPPAESDVLEAPIPSDTIFGHVRYLKYVLHNEWGSWNLPKKKTKKKRTKRTKRKAE